VSNAPNLSARSAFRRLMFSGSRWRYIAQALRPTRIQPVSGGIIPGGQRPARRRAGTRSDSPQNMGAN